MILHDLRSQFPDGTEFWLVTFGDKVEQEVSLKGDHAFDEFLAGLSLAGTKESTTALYEALAAGIKQLGEPRPGDAEFLITAWEDGGKSDIHAAVAQQLSAGPVRVFGISFDSSRLPGVPPATFVSETSFTPIEGIARTSGGVWIRTSGTGPAADMLPKYIAAMMSDFYSVVLKLKQPITKMETLKIELAKESKINLKPKLSPKDIVLSYPLELYACH